jgi:hypothetical protein
MHLASNTHEKQEKMVHDEFQEQVIEQATCHLARLRTNVAAVSAVGSGMAAQGSSLRTTWLDT